MAQALTVRISSPEHVVWEGQARSVSSKNTRGPFDILPQHANFITVVEKVPIKVRVVGGKTEEHTFDHSVIYAHDDQVFIYTTL